MGRFVFGLFALLISFAPIQAQAQTIAVVTHGQASDPFWSVVQNGVLTAANEAGVTTTYSAPETFDMDAMARLIHEAIDQKPDGLVVSLPDAATLGPALERAQREGIPLITMNSGSDEAFLVGSLLHVGQNEFAAGMAAGNKLTELGATEALCINQEVGNTALDLRCAGFAEGFEGNVTVLSSTISPDANYNLVRSALQQNPNINGVLTLGAATVGEPALDAIEAEGKTGQVLLGSFDLSAKFLTAVTEGRAVFAIDQQQFLQGYLPVMFLSSYIRFGLVPSSDVQSGPNLITADKAQQVINLSEQKIR